MLKKVQNNQFSKVENNLFEFGFIELKDREVKIKREIGESFFKLTIVSIDDMDKF